MSTHQLSPTQARALAQLAAVTHFARSVAGWGPPDALGLNAFQTSTMNALAARGFVKFTRGGGRIRTVAISALGRASLARVRAAAERKAA